MNELLKLDNQLCFPLYSASREILRKYTPFLKKLNLTYTQYIVMMVMWEHKSISIKDMGKLLYLDSGTLTPMLKKMESAGLICRKRSEDDERIGMVSITERGEELQERASEVPSKMVGCMTLESDEAMKLYTLLHNMMETFKLK